MRWGEPLSVFDSTAIENTKEQIDLYLESKGYFDAEVDYSVKCKGLNNRRVTVIYNIKEKQSYKIDTVLY